MVRLIKRMGRTEPSGCSARGWCQNHRGWCHSTSGKGGSCPGVPVGDDQDRRGVEFVADLADHGFHGRGEKELGSLLEQGRDGA